MPVPESHGNHVAGLGHDRHSGDSGHDRHSGHSVAMFRDKFLLSLALTLPVVAWSMDPQDWLGCAAPAFPGSTLLPAVLGTIVLLYGGLVFLRGARGGLGAPGAAGRRPGHPANARASRPWNTLERWLKYSPPRSTQTPVQRSACIPR